MPEPAASNSAQHALYPPLAWYTRRRALVNTIPTELIERILDHLYDDVRTLKACTLVCRAWFTRSRYHLFAHVQLGSPRIDEFLHCFDANTLRGMRGLTACVPRDLRFKLDRTPSSCSQLEDQFAKVCSVLPNIEFLRLATFPPAPRLPSWLANYQNTLTHLVIQTTVFTTTSAFIIAISGLRALRHLGVEYVRWMTLDFPSPEEFPVSGVLESLSLHTVAGDKIVQWILGVRAPPPLTRVCLFVNDAEVAQEVVVVYKHLAKSLEFIYVTQDVLKFINLSSFPALRHIIFSDISVFQNQSSSAQHLKTHLSSITSPHLHSLVFRIVIDKLENLQNNVDWRGIVALLEDDRFKGLKRIDFSLGLFSGQAKHVILKYFEGSWVRERIYFTGFDVHRGRVLRGWF